METEEKKTKNMLIFDALENYSQMTDKVNKIETVIEEQLILSNNMKDQIDKVNYVLENMNNIGTLVEEVSMALKQNDIITEKLGNSLKFIEKQNDRLNYLLKFLNTGKSLTVTKTNNNSEENTPAAQPQIPVKVKKSLKEILSENQMYIVIGMAIIFFITMIFMAK